MKKIFEIYKDDIRSIFKNYAAIIVLAALCIIPSLYAWFNIKASWDPYSQDATSGIKVGVVNLDKGANFSGKDINIGDEVIGQLKDNKQLGWQFVSEEEAERNVENGNYYAHTLNNTVVAPPRMLIAILENNYQPDGSVIIPEVLRPYMGGTEKIVVK